MTHLTTVVILYHHPENGRMPGQNTLVNVLNLEEHYKIRMHLLVVYTFYKFN